MRGSGLPLGALVRDADSNGEHTADDSLLGDTRLTAPTDLPFDLHPDPDPPVGPAVFSDFSQLRKRIFAALPGVAGRFADLPGYSNEVTLRHCAADFSPDQDGR
ncbi:hypothetical protein GCM10027597_41030 [Saccharopolyspora tripterygii]